MPTKIRLQRRGRKAKPFYHIVIADGRAPRDGKFIEKIGTYNPITEPADIQLNFDRALYWLQSGAQPTDTVKTILSYKGVTYKHHLLKGVKKGAHTEEQAEAKFKAWLSEKEEKIANKTQEVASAEKDALKKKFDAEKLVKENRAKEIAAKRAATVEKEVEAVKAKASAETAVEETVEAVVEEVAEKAAEEPKAEEPKEEPKAEETKEEPKAEESKEEPKAEETKEEPKAEESKEEPKAEETKEEPKAEESKEEPKEEKKEEKN
jgi:small subunit ribosomal protein S16